MTIEKRDICLAKVGLLTLRECGESMETHCALCNRPICKEHMITTQSKLMCPECAFRQKTGSRRRAYRGPSNRHRYYESYGYQPVYYGHDHYYNDYDSRSFDRSTSHNSQPMSTENEGEFGGAGAAGSWDEGAEPVNTHVSEEPGAGGFETEDFMES
ncbi:MAG: hypothetical protein ACMUJM_23510 [bacterium]